MRRPSILCGVMLVLVGVVHGQIVAPVESCPPAVTESGLCYAESSPSTQFWIRGEYVAWAFGTERLANIAKELYQSDLFNSLLAADGKDYKDFAETLLGNDRTGFRLSAGAWLTSDQSVGVEVAYLYLNRGPLELSFGNRDRSPLARIIPNSEFIIERQRRFDPTFENVDHPFLLALLARRLGLPAIDENGRQIVVTVGDRDLIDANIQMKIAASNFWMLDTLVRARVFESCNARVDAVFGYRHASYSDSLSYQSVLRTLVRPLLPGTSITSIEEVHTQNNFDGALFGLDFAADCGPWTFTARPTATIAHLNATVIRDALTVLTLPDRRILRSKAGPHLTGDTLGEVSATTWTVLPELAVGVSRSFGDHVRFTLGSSFLFFPEMAFSPAQFELGIEASRSIPGRSRIPQRPVTLEPDLRSMFLSTFSAGLELRF